MISTICPVRLDFVYDFQMNLAGHRAQLLGWVKENLIGPVKSDLGDTLRGIRPADRFPCGVLFPVIRGEEGLDVLIDDPEEGDADWADVTVESAETGESSESAAEPVHRRRRHVPPSAAGFSFFVRGRTIRLEARVSAVSYQREGERDEKGRFIREEWTRQPLQCSVSEAERLVFCQPASREGTANERVLVFNGKAGVDVVWRPLENGWIVTLSLFNARELDSMSGEEWSDAQNSESLFEVSLTCLIHEGEVGEYPRVDPSLLTDEERELELQYRSRRILAVGHGAAVEWVERDGAVREIRTEFLPTAEVPMVTADLPEREGDVLDLEKLALFGRDERASGELVELLERFVEAYGEWIEQRRVEAGTLGDNETAYRIVARMDAARGRMRRGVDLLRRDKQSAKAFGLANRAMSDQMKQSAKLRGREGQPRRWRPFQLAFLLTTIESVVDEDSPDRDTVDLIWFPTGGGKTEAYLGLIAFLIALRRLRFPDKGGGTTALMRYTLRLLTAQQFERATRLICAMELIRRTDPGAGLGKEPVTLGMWVGGETSPNRFQDAAKFVKEAADERQDAPVELVIRKCPWCDDPFQPGRNYHATPNEFHFLCRNPECDFSGESEDGGVIPCNVVDEALYQDPPTLLIATIDKFARLAWEERAIAFFGRNGNRPPELIIQDELHLIAGALGSVAGLYEAALDTVLTRRGAPPKFVASTATIRMAEEQVRSLYGRNVAVFPPPGLDCDDSYFARTVPLAEKPGRLYAGYLAPLRNRQRCMAPLAATLLAAPEAVFGPGLPDREALLDCWWTQVVYHGSLKGVDTSHNSCDTEVVEWFRRIADEVEACPDDPGQGGRAPQIERDKPVVVQLTSKSDARQNAATFARLEHDRTHPHCIDAVLATNMISVGLDVARLALMVVNGQPLMTAEYIQSTSRVGRGEVPGLVFANYYRDQARSLSHYENFRAYHESFYRFVEPTSVTPYTYQARARALHAALVIAVRNSVCGMAPNNAAGDFRVDDEAIRKVVDDLAIRCGKASGERAGEVRRHLKSLVMAWDDRARCAEGQKRMLTYSQRANVNNADRLLFNHGDAVTGLWLTLQSMRNVEDTGLLKQL